MIRKILVAWVAIAVIGFGNDGAGANEPEIIIIGSVEGAIDFWKRLDFWGEADRPEDLMVPRALLVAINRTWKEEADSIPVPLKKELFYRDLLPLALYANELILQDRARLEAIVDGYRRTEVLGAEDREWLEGLAARYRLARADGAATVRSDSEYARLIDELLRRVDAIPPSLALGQAAYESGYGTSRFTLLGNALYGQWTYGGRGITPERQRSWKGDYKIAAFEWPLDSVRAYMRNLNTHRTYAPLRHLRSDIRRRGDTPTGMELAGTLVHYSERGETYVRTLRSIIRVNKLDIADKTRLRDEPPVLMVNVDTEEEIAQTRKELDRLRATGELAKLIESMRLDSD